MLLSRVFGSKENAQATIQFMVIVGMLGLLLALNFFNTFSRPKGLSDEGIAKVEEMLKTFEKAGQESIQILEEIKLNNLELQRFLNSKTNDRQSTYEQMMAEYLNSTRGDDNAFDANYYLGPDTQELLPDDTE